MYLAYVQTTYKHILILKAKTVKMEIQLKVKEMSKYFKVVYALKLGSTQVPSNTRM